MHRCHAMLVLLVALATGCLLSAPAALADMRTHMEFFSSLDDRTTGTEGNRKAADYIEDHFKKQGFEFVDRQDFSTVVRERETSSLSIADTGATAQLPPLFMNAVSPETTGMQGVSGPLVYVGRGTLEEMNGLPITDAIVVMDLASGKNWLNAASLGAKALIYVAQGEPPRGLFEDKHELNPIEFPRFFLTEAQAREVLPNFAGTGSKPTQLADEARVHSRVRWQPVAAQNIFCLVEGSHPAYSDQIIVVEAHYDTKAMVAGSAPGADESSSISALLELAEMLGKNQPRRSFLLLATGAHGQELAGYREFIWALKTKSKTLRDKRFTQQDLADQSAFILERLALDEPMAGLQGREAEPVRLALDYQVKNETDIVSRKLSALRLAKSDDSTIENELVEKQRALRSLIQSGNYADLSPAQAKVLAPLVPRAVALEETRLAESRQRLDELASAAEIRREVIVRDPQAFISLHLSSHGDAVGSFRNGWMYTIRPDRNLAPAYTVISNVLSLIAEPLMEKPEYEGAYVDALRPNRITPWQTYFLDKPHLGGEVASAGGYVGITLASTHDARPYWGTPFDTVDNVDFANISKQKDFMLEMLAELGGIETLLVNATPRLGYGELAGRCLFIRQGELFAEQAAPGTIIQAYQGFIDNAMYHVWVDARGNFRIPGVCSKKLVVGKVILEAYKFDEESGRIKWAIDKNATGKDRYRVKMTYRYMETDLTMFACRQTTVMGLLEPRTFSHMTKLKLIDGRRDTWPMRYWYSRIDTRRSSISSIFVEATTPLKLTLSDTWLDKKLILTGHDADSDSEGDGYLLANWPLIAPTEYRVATDMWSLLTPRIADLESKGIVNPKIAELEARGTGALATARDAYHNMDYSTFMESARTSWALASRVYNDLEATQQDILLGVLFYVALFVPFAYCAERILFNFTDIHRRILGFLGCLAVVIGIVYMVHPAFQLTYSPLVVILAFFIVGLSVMVSLIIFMRFEREMMQMQIRAGTHTGEVSRWKAFLSAFSIGVSNLRRRKIRTALTVVTLVILTFTIMSFTAVKSVRQETRVKYDDSAVYQGIFLQHMGWRPLPPEAMSIVTNRYAGEVVAAPLVWLENERRTASVSVPLSIDGTIKTGEALIGLSAQEPAITGVDKTLIAGRWFTAEEDKSLIISSRMASLFGLTPEEAVGADVKLWGMDFSVAGVFDAQRLDDYRQLNDETITPVIFPNETAEEMSGANLESLQEGGEVRAFQSRYEHVNAGLSIIAPARTVLALGGNLVGFSVKPSVEVHTGDEVQTMATDLVDRFGLTIFAGLPGGTYIYNASDSLNYAGVPNIIVPLAIAVLIVLNTMISSVYERKGEIGVYTSIGMAPTHVSYLFIAEALAFAVVSTVLGYLLAQFSAAVLAGTPLWEGMTANYSSLGGVFAMALVIAVVMLSVIYPSRVAGEIAIPDVNRAWKFPDVTGNTLTITLPFLLKYPEQECIGGFLYDYYSAHEDVSHGLFCSDAVGCSFACPAPSPAVPIVHDEFYSKNPCLNLKTDVWLAPFDFGVKQHVNITFCPSQEFPDYLEIQVNITRLAGEHSMWKRINRGFLNDLRKQLLVWRSLGTKEREDYVTIMRDYMQEVAGVDRLDQTASPLERTQTGAAG